MKLGDWFSAVENVKAVNPKPIIITIICTKDVLPNGQQNPGGRPVKARGKAALVMMGGKEVVQSRVRARQLLAELVEPLASVDELSGEKRPPRTDGGDEAIAVMYEQLCRVLREWDDPQQALGGPLFPNAEIAMEMVTFEEANRIMREYNAYMAAEHPTEVTAQERTKSPGQGVRVAAGPPAPR